MALNIQSGSTWAEIRAELNNKAFDKNGDVLHGNIFDTNGNEAIKIDVDNKEVLYYGNNGESVVGDGYLTFDIGDMENILIDIPEGMKRGICYIGTKIIGEETSSSRGMYAVLFINTNPNGSVLSGEYVALGGVYRQVSGRNRTSFATGYISENKIHIHVDSSIYNRCACTISWEVW